MGLHNKKDGRAKVFLEIIELLWEYSHDGLYDIADAAGVSVCTVKNWRYGHVGKPRIDTLSKVAGVLGYDIKIVHTGRRLTPQVRDAERA